MTVFIGGAWPYANGSLHLGHIAGLLPGDILARYFRLKGEEVLYVSGSDCHGTPISIRAAQEKVSPEEIAGRYHEEFAGCFQKLGFSYDFYGRTDQPFHHKVTQELFLELYRKDVIYRKTIRQNYCTTCSSFLPDRYVEGKCPHCGSPARGDQCEACSALLDPEDLIGKKCRLCGGEPELRPSEHLFFALSSFQQVLEKYVGDAEGWRENAVHLASRYLQEGLQDRDVTRDLPWGVDIPLEGFEGKKIYVWIEAVIGYLSASKQWAEREKKDWKAFWDEDVTAYYVHGKDNIPFHAVILPALLAGAGGLHLPDRIISSEYLTIEGKKLSTSRNWAVWVPDVLERYNPDSFRYFLTINGPEKRDSDFSWREFVYRHNAELLGAFGNLVNRTVVFVEKSFEGAVPEGFLDAEFQRNIPNTYLAVGKKIEKGEFKSAADEVFSLVRYTNKYFDEQQPWKQIKADREACGHTLYNCIQVIANLSVLLSPILPFTCQKLQNILALTADRWKPVSLPPFHRLNQSAILFTRLDEQTAERESSRLGNG